MTQWLLDVLNIALFLLALYAGAIALGFSMLLVAGSASALSLIAERRHQRKIELLDRMVELEAAKKVVPATSDNTIQPAAAEAPPEVKEVASEEPVAAS